MGLRNLSIVFLLLAGILIFAACGGSTTLLDDPDALADTAMPAVTEASGESMSGIPGIPLDSPDDAAAHTASSVPAGLGQDYIMMNGGYLDGTALVLENHPEYDPDSDTDPPLELSYAMYKASGLEGMRPESLNIECIPGGLGQGYFVGIADYTTANWQWFGPVGFPEFELDLTEHTHQFVTNLGNMYFIIVVPPGNSATHYQYSVLSGPSDPGTQPGLPHHLVASDGQFPEQVRLSWLGGTGAAQYQIFRRAARGEDCEWHAIGTTSETSYIDSPLPDYKMFYYRVRSVNDAGDSTWSNPDSGFAGGGDDPCVIHGEIMSMAGEPLPGVYVGLVGFDDLKARVTNADGEFYFGDLPPGEYLVAPRHSELTFFPTYRHVDLTTERVADIHFNAAPEDAFHRVGGFTFTYNNDAAEGEMRFCPLAGVTMALHPVGDPETQMTVTTDEFGFYVIEDIPDGVHILRPQLEGMNFIPGMAEIVINGTNRPDRHDFMGVPADEPPPVE